MKEELKKTRAWRRFESWLDKKSFDESLKVPVKRRDSLETFGITYEEHPTEKFEFNPELTASVGPSENPVEEQIASHLMEMEEDELADGGTPNGITENKDDV